MLKGSEWEAYCKMEGQVLVSFNHKVNHKVPLVLVSAKTFSCNKRLIAALQGFFHSVICQTWGWQNDILSIFSMKRIRKMHSGEIQLCKVRKIKTLDGFQNQLDAQEPKRDFCKRPFIFIRMPLFTL